jgi:hypothetical protein
MEGMYNRPRAQQKILNVESAVLAMDTPLETVPTSVEKDNSQEGSENLPGGN